MAIVARTTEWLEPTGLTSKAEYMYATYPTDKSKIVLLTTCGRGPYIIVMCGLCRRFLKVFQFEPAGLKFDLLCPLKIAR